MNRYLFPGGFIVALVCLSIAASSGTVFSGCMAAPSVLALVNIVDCKGVMFEASPSLRKYSPGKGLPGDEKGARITGVLITADVEESTLVWPVPTKDDRSYINKLPRGRSKLLFIKGSAEWTCPGLLPKRTHVVTQDRCCDVLPLTDICLVPQSIPDVSEETNPGRWYKHEGKAITQ